MIVCAALRYPDGTIVVGPRHFDHIMQAQIGRLAVLTVYKDLSAQNIYRPEQGFISQDGVFIDRRTAWVAAEACGQIKKRVGGDGYENHGLFSENLY